MELLFTNAQEVEPILQTMIGLAVHPANGKATDDRLLELTGNVSSMAKQNSLQRVDWVYTFTSIGALTIRMHLKDYGPINGFVEKLLAKHRNYGAAPLTKWGPLGIVIRIDSKLERLLNLRRGVRDEVGEAEKDTCLDIIGYAVLGRKLVMR